MGQRVIGHLDMDAFYAAVEQRDQPLLRDTPVIVGGPPNSRGVVSAASYEARAYGVRSAMPSREAHRLCPHAVFLPVRMDRYAEVSHQVMNLLGQFSPRIEQISIDEAFFDLTGTQRLLGPGEQVARRLKQRIRTELGLTASIGLAPNKLVAKIASDLLKPDALVIVKPDQVTEFLAALPVSRLWGVGPATEKSLKDIGIIQIRQLQQCSLPVLVRAIGPRGEDLWNLARGRDSRPLISDSQIKSVSHETTFEVDVCDPETLETVLLGLCEQVAWRLRKHAVVGSVVHLKLRYSSFRTLTRSRKLPSPTDLETVVYGCGRALLRSEKLIQPVRLIGVGVSQLQSAGADQPLLFDESGKKQRRLAEAADRIRTRYGRAAITRARLINRSEDR